MIEADPPFLKNKWSLARGALSFGRQAPTPQRSIIHADVLFPHSYGG